ncbi:MAG: phosphatidate cytidylyltransferase [Planctomycetes bacterium]|nr:phosphatidate cytidylyltransferase [Planctomycetota bacterium]
MRRNRVLTGIAASALVIAILAADHYFVHGFPSAALLALVAFAASYELCLILESAGVATFPKLTAFASFAVALMPVLVNHFYSQTSSFAWQAGLIFLFMILTFAIALAKPDPNAGAKAVISGTFVLMYVGFALSFLVRLRGLPQVGNALLIFVLACSKVGDSAAYFVGRMIGKHPFARRISPRKTVEGAVAAFAASLLVAVVMARFVAGSVSLVQLLLWAALLSVAAQFGDLAESLLKRAGAVKDSSSIIGAVGGTLDVVDSLLLCAPTAYILALAAGLGAGPG